MIAQYQPVKDKVKKLEINRMRDGYIADVLTSVDIQEIVKTERNLFEIYEGVIYGETFKLSPFRKVINDISELRRKYKDENNDVIQLLVKLILNSIYGEQLRKDIEERYSFESKHWIQTECDEREIDYQKIIN